MTDSLHLDEFEAYLLVEKRSPVTICGYTGDVRLFARWFEQAYSRPLTPNALTPEAVRAYQEFLLDQPARPRTIRRRLAALALYAHWLKLAGYVEDAPNPVQGLRSIRQPGTAPRRLTAEQAKALQQAIAAAVEEAARRYPRLQLMVLRDAAIVQLILYAGLRVSEIVQLQLTDVILEPLPGKVLLRAKGNAGQREISLHPAARQALQAYQRIRPAVASERLFLGQRNEGVQAKTIQRAVQRFAGEAGLEGVNPQVLRYGGGGQKGRE